MSMSHTFAFSVVSIYSSSPRPPQVSSITNLTMKFSTAIAFLGLALLAPTDVSAQAYVPTACDGCDTPGVCGNTDCRDAVVANHMSSCASSWDQDCANIAKSTAGPYECSLCEAPPPDVPLPPSNDHCWDAQQIVCDRSYAGSNILATADPFANIWDGDTCGDHSFIVEQGVWFKLSTGSDTFDVTFSTCGGGRPGPRNDRTWEVSLWGPGPLGKGCSVLDDKDSPGDQDIMCLDSQHNNADPECTLQTRVGPNSIFEDEDYWILIESWGTPTLNEGEFILDVKCDGNNLAEVDDPDFLGPNDPLGPIDPWFIQRSAEPAPGILNVDPVEGGLWLELHPDRIPGTAPQDDIPDLFQQIYTVDPLNPDQPCDAGTPVDATFVEYACIPNTDPLEFDCPEAMSEGIPVRQSFTIENAFDDATGISFEDDSQLRFCVHNELKINFLNGEKEEDGDEMDSVSYFSTYFVIEVDFTAKFMLGVSTFERNPGNVEDLFDDFNVVPYLCEDGNIPGTTEFAPIEDTFLVGENFRICVRPGDVFADTFKVASFIGVICETDDAELGNGIEGQSRMLIMDGSVTGDEDPLTEIVDPPLGSTYERVLAFESTVTTGLVEGQFNGPNGEGTFKCKGSVILEPFGGRRALQEGGEPLTGTFNVEITVIKPSTGLSTGAIVGIAVGALAIFLVVLLILYRRGCFDKKKRDAHPKTVTVEEASETTGSKDGEDNL